MSRQQTDNERLMDADTRAFEYVAGTLRGSGRKAFAKQLETSAALQQSVSFWEQQLFGLQDIEDTLAPRADTWDNIAGKIAAPAPAAEPSRWNPLSWLPWGLSGALSLLLLYSLNLGQIGDSAGPAAQLPADYVAVLTDTTGDAQLTALTVGDSQTMWLQWGEMAIESDRAVQLWAISRSDGETRSLAVLENTGDRQLALSDAHWRLVKDAAFLILSEEESGGSPLDEPSDRVLARGECVRFQAGDNSTG